MITAISSAIPCWHSIPSTTFSARLVRKAYGVGIPALRSWRNIDRSQIGCVIVHLPFSLGGRCDKRVSTSPVAMAVPAIDRSTGEDSYSSAATLRGWGVSKLGAIPLDVVRTFTTSSEGLRIFNGTPQLAVIGHRGCGKNVMPRTEGTIDVRPSIKENTITSFNQAGKLGATFVEFDVQVTKDGRAVIFHDDLILTERKASSIGEITLEEFLSIGPQRQQGQEGQTLYRKTTGKPANVWTATVDEGFCTLREAFEQVDQKIGFNIEVKFHDKDHTSERELRRVIEPILEDVRSSSKGRKIYYSSFHPDAVSILRKDQSSYPVFFLTDGAVNHPHDDERRNSMEAAIEVCKQNDLQGIVAEVKVVLTNPNAAKQVKTCGLWLLTYGDLNNTVEALQVQAELGVSGVIVDHVSEIVNAAFAMQTPI